MFQYSKKSLKFALISLCLLFFIGFLSAQSISLEEIWSGKFYPKSISDIKSMKNGEFYTILSHNRIDKYSYQNLVKIETIIQGEYIDYQFSPNEEYLLLETTRIPIYRHSKKSTYNLYNLKNQTFYNISKNKPIQEPVFSPDGSKLAFVYENNIYYQEIPSLKTVQITFDGEKNKIINGLSDWVYEEELGTVRQFEWSADGKYIAFVRFDESNVKQVNIPVYQNKLYPENFTFKYPKAGEENSKVSLHIYDLENDTLTPDLLKEVENDYIIKIKFSPLGDLVVITSNRLQNKIDLSSISPSKGLSKKLLSEMSLTWIDTDDIFLEFLKNGNFIINSEKNGFNHLYLHDKNGKLIKQLTKGEWEITKVYGIDDLNQKIYFQSTQRGAENRTIAVTDIKTGKHTILVGENGTHHANFSSDFSYFVDIFSTANTPPVYTLKDNTGNILKTLEDNSSLLSYINRKEIRLLEFIKIPNEKGDILNAYIIRPKNFDINKKYPVLMHVYGGPGIQTVNNSWDSFDYWWHQMLAQQGYIIVSVDGRGTGGRGSSFKKVIYKQLGKLELEDQIAAAKWLKSQSYIDENRIGIWGWSFGGYLTSLAMTKGGGIFKTGIAVAPVTNWRFYDTIYTERFLQTPQLNPKGYDDNSPLNFADNISGNYLIIHGMADDNVHFQNSAEMIETLVQKGKQFDMAIYPDKNHGIYGGLTRYQLYQKMTNYIKNNL